MNKNENLKNYFDNKFSKEDNYNKIMDKIKSTGEEKVKTKKFKGLYVLAPVCVIVLVLGTFLGFNIYNDNKVVSYLSIDINPSIMLGVNEDDKVKEIDNLNDEAKEVTEGLELENMLVEDATSKIIDRAVELGYITEEEDDNAVLISTYCDNQNKANNMKNRVNNSVNNNLNARGIRALIIDEELTTEDAKKANEYGVSEAKILFVKKALEENLNLEFEDLIYLPAREIAKYISEYDSVTGGNGQGQGNGNGNGSGQGQGNGNGQGYGNNQAQNQSSNKGQGQGSRNGNGDRLRKQDGTGNNCNGINCQNQN